MYLELFIGTKKIFFKSDLAFHSKERIKNVVKKN
jgi:hypothetical protein